MYIWGKFEEPLVIHTKKISNRITTKRKLKRNNNIEIGHQICAICPIFQHF